MVKRVKEVLEAYSEALVAWLNHVTRVLNGEKDKAYWQGYADGIRDERECNGNS